MTYCIIRYTLIMTYFFIICKKMNKTNGQIKSLKIKNITYFGTEKVCEKTL
jgi:hypothetical protein